ncbi:hypothetical protein D9M72_558600 [compost metagenome]
MIPFGEVVFKTVAVFPLQRESVVGKFGVILFVNVKLMVSVISNPQLFMAVRVIVTTLPACEALEVYVVDRLFGVEKVPLGADHLTDWCPCAIPFKEIVVPAQAVRVAGPALTVKGWTGAEQPLLMYVGVPAGLYCTIAPSAATVAPLVSISSARS